MNKPELVITITELVVDLERFPEFRAYKTALPILCSPLENRASQKKMKLEVATLVSAAAAHGNFWGHGGQHMVR